MSPQPSRIRTGSIDEYLAGLTPERRAALERLRRIIMAAAPKADECISYGLPAIRLDGRVLVYFGATTKHCSFFPGSGTTVAAHARLLQDYDTSKGTIRFQPGKPLPVALVRKLIKARIAENAALSQRPGKAGRSSAARRAAALSSSRTRHQ